MQRILRLVSNEYGLSDGSARQVEQAELWIDSTPFRHDLGGRTEEERFLRRMAEDLGAEFQDCRQDKGA